MATDVYSMDHLTSPHDVQPIATSVVILAAYNLRLCGSWVLAVAVNTRTNKGNFFLGGGS